MKMVMLGLLTLAGIGCNPGLTSVHTPWVYVDPAVPLGAAQDGMLMWRDAVGIDWAITTERNKAAVTIVSVSDGCVGPHGKLIGGWDDEGSTQASICMANFQLEDPDEVVNLSATIAHELGHVMHLGHIPDAVLAVMNRDPGLQTSVSDADKRAWHAIWGVLPESRCPINTGCY